MAFRTIESEMIYRGRVFTVRRDRVEYPDGKQGHLDIVEHNGAVVLVPVDEQGNIWFVRQYRHPAGESLLELPAGVLEESEEAGQAARREVREETGMAAAQIHEIGQFFLAPGYSTEFMHVFLATELSDSPLEQDEDEFLSVEKIPWQTALEMARTGQIRDAKSLAALLLAGPYLEQASGQASGQADGNENSK